MNTRRNKVSPLLLVGLITCLSYSAMAAPSDNDGPVANGKAGASEITWQPNVPCSSIVLTVAAPEGETFRQEFPSGTNPSFGITDELGLRRPDGHYKFQLRVIPIISLATKKALATARAAGNEEEVIRTLRRRGLLPKEDIVQAGAFMIENGAFVMGGATEEEKLPGSQAGGSSGNENVSVTPNDQVIADDLIVQGSGCFGFDCINNENFGADTIRLKENNLRIHFDDTSNTGSFPFNDWRIVANDQDNGGASYLAFEDSTAGRFPFTVEAGAPSNTLYVDNTGRIGIKTSTPLLDIHAVNGNTPAMRLEQTSASGFQAQTWDIAGNEANFFIRDATNGSKLPFKIKPGAPDNSIFVASSGNVGLGTTSPEERLHVFGNAVIQGNIDIRSDQFGASHEVDPKTVLGQLDQVSLVSSAVGNGASANHMQPNIKELNTAFGLGTGNRISLLDIDGINMAAVKAVYNLLKEKDAEIAALQKQLADLETRLKAVESRVSKK